MAVPGNYQGAGRDAIFAPLTDKFNRNFLPFEVNGEKPVALQWFNGGEVGMIPIMPKAQKQAEVDTKATPPKETEIRISKFFGNGGSVLNG